MWLGNLEIAAAANKLGICITIHTKKMPPLLHNREAKDQIHLWYGNKHYEAIERETDKSRTGNAEMNGGRGGMKGKSRNHKEKKTQGDRGGVGTMPIKPTKFGRKSHTTERQRKKREREKTRK